MVPDYKTYLAANVLNEGNVVSYRNLSRDLGVHSNVAKSFLFDFHRRENAKRPNSVYATYLLRGTSIRAKPLSAENSAQQDGEGSNMQSSPFMSSSMPQNGEEEDDKPETLVVLAREEDLESVRTRFTDISSIHVYSLGPSTIQNLQILSNCNRAIYAKFVHQDPLESGKQYGVIANPRVKRRTGKRQIPVAVPQVAASTLKKPNSKSLASGTAPTTGAAPAERKILVTKPLSQKENKAQVNPEVKSQQIKGGDRKSGHKPSTVKREQSDLFKSFSKPKPKLEREDTGSSASGSLGPASVHSLDGSELMDEPMHDASEDEQDDAFIADMESTSIPSKLSRTARAEKLRKMMDDEDEVMSNTAEESLESKQTTAPASQDETPTEPPVVVSGGRRRGRRKVMKKKMLKDEEGYLVTKEEPAWESFSEDEPPPQKARTPATTALSTDKAKKVVGKPGQGNIMSFFGKR